MDNEFDVLCSITDPRLQADPAFAVKPKARFGMCLLMAASHPVAALAPDKALAHSVGFPFVLFEQNWTMNRKLADHLAQLDLAQPQVAMRTDSVLSILNMIRETDCVGFVAAPIARFVDMAGLAALPLEAPSFRMEVGLMHRQAIEELGLFRRFEQEVDRVLAELGLDKG
jgi:DNA-binding transcriptional LysR family regulator